MTRRFSWNSCQSLDRISRWRVFMLKVSSEFFGRWHRPVCQGVHTGCIAMSEGEEENCDWHAHKRVQRDEPWFISMVLDAQKGTIGSAYDGLLDNLISTEYLPRWHTRQCHTHSISGVQNCKSYLGARFQLIINTCLLPASQQGRGHEVITRCLVTWWLLKYMPAVLDL